MHPYAYQVLGDAAASWACLRAERKRQDRAHIRDPSVGLGREMLHPLCMVAEAWFPTVGCGRLGQFMWQVVHTSRNPPGRSSI